MPTLFHRNLSLGTLFYVLIIASILLMLGLYALFQARHVIEGPVIALASTTYPGGATLTLEGRAENIVSLLLNGRPIYTDDAGNFKETIVLPMGYTIVTFEARDRYGRTRALEQAYVRTDATITPQS